MNTLKVTFSDLTANYAQILCSNDPLRSFKNKTLCFQFTTVISEISKLEESCIRTLYLSIQQISIPNKPRNISTSNAYRYI